MRAIAIESFGGPERLKRMDLEPPELGPFDVLIRVAAAGINPVDWKIREGMLKDRFPHRFPLIPGWEAAGVIKAVGAIATRFERGDPVYTYARLPEVQWGTHAEFVVAPESIVVKKPTSLLFHEAAAVPLAGLTAYQALFRRAGLSRGATVLIHAAAGGVGHLAIQLARSAGAKVIGTASKVNQTFIRELGVEHAIDYRAEDFRAAVRRICPDGVDVVLDTVGGEVLRRSYDVVARGGRLIGVVDPPDAAEAERRGFMACYHFVEPSSEDLATLGALADEGKLRPHVSAFYPLDRAALAQQKSREGHTRGKAVLLL